MFKSIANLASMMSQAKSISEKMQSMGEQLRNQRVTGSAGGGLVEVEVNGAGEVLGLKIDPSLAGDREMIEDLVPAACNEAQAKARELHAEAMKEMTDGLDIPGVGEALSRFNGPG